MKQKFIIVLTLIFGLTLLSCNSQDEYVSFHGYAQGGVYSVTINLKGVDVPLEEITARVDEILSEIDNSLSGYNRGSLVSKFNAGETIKPDNLFLDMYQHAVAFYDRTGGVVDVASAPLFDLWGFGFKTSEMPSDDVVMNTLGNCGMGRLKKDIRTLVREDGTLVPKDMLNEGHEVLPQLNYNAIAQGYSCDRVASYLYSIGVKDMMVNIGEIFCDGKNPDGKPWRLGIDSPIDGNNEMGANLQAVFSVPQGPHGVVTSGNYRKFYVKNGKKYAHTIDPRSGYPVSHNLLSATVIAPDAMTADAYATYCMAVGLEESKAILEASGNMEGCLIYDHEGEFRVWTTPGFKME